MTLLTYLSAWAALGLVPRGSILSGLPDAVSGVIRDALVTAALAAPAVVAVGADWWLRRGERAASRATRHR
jgi:hypothetical protein